jgi:hypothetical protein
MTMMKREWLGAALLTLMGSAAHADLITIDPDDYAPGTDLSHVVEGVILERLSQHGVGNRYTPTVSAIYAGVPCRTAGATQPCTVAPTGDQMFAATPTSSGGSAFYDSWYANDCITRGTRPSGASGCVTGYNVLSVRFEAGTSFVSIDGMWTSDMQYLYAYNAAGELVASCLGAPTCMTRAAAGGSYFTGTSSVYRAEADIAWIIAGGDNGVAGLDRLIFEAPASVPEPATLGLLLAGLAGGLVTRRKKQAS